MPATGGGDPEGENISRSRLEERLGRINAETLSALCARYSNISALHEGMLQFNAPIVILFTKAFYSISFEIAPW